MGRKLRLHLPISIYFLLLISWKLFRYVIYYYYCINMCILEILNRMYYLIYELIDPSINWMQQKSIILKFGATNLCFVYFFQTTMTLKDKGNTNINIPLISIRFKHINIHSWWFDFCVICFIFQSYFLIFL